MPRQFVNPAPVLHDILGIDPAFNGSLTFYEIGTTTPKDTWSDYDQNILNENPVPLDSAARSNTQIWGEGEYTIVLRNADGETVWTRDWRPEQAGSDALPAKESGKFLTTDGESWLLDSITQVPDPTGFSGRILSTDGANVLWVTPASVMPEPPEPPEIDIEVGANWFSASPGSGSRYHRRWLNDTAPATGSNKTEKSVTFGVTFLEPPAVQCQVNASGVNSSGWLIASGITNITTTGCTVNFDTLAGNEGGGRVDFSVPFTLTIDGRIGA